MLGEASNVCYLSVKGIILVRSTISGSRKEELKVTK